MRWAHVCLLKCCKWVHLCSRLVDIAIETAGVGSCTLRARCYEDEKQDHHRAPSAPHRDALLGTRHAVLTHGWRLPACKSCPYGPKSIKPLLASVMCYVSMISAVRAAPLPPSTAVPATCQGSISVLTLCSKRYLDKLSQFRHTL